MAFSIFLGRVNKKILPQPVKNLFNLLGSYWLVIMCYAILFFLFTDLVIIILPCLGLYDIISYHIPNLYLYWITAVIIFIIGAILYGTYNAKNIKVNTYDITIPKKSPIKNLNIVFLSDIHLGNKVNNKRLKQIVDKINSLNPDMVIIGGDIIDDTIGPYIKQNMSETLKKIRAPYGVYAVLGNHDGNYKGQTNVVKNLEAGGMKVLLDEYVKINDSFYLVGRMDNNMPRGGPKRKNLAEILEGVDASLPVMVIDHNPAKFMEAKKQNADLQLSGHTHAGQFFPISLVTKSIFATHWGYLKMDNFHLIVSSGAATWGPPLRIGSHSEIVKVNIEFH